MDLTKEPFDPGIDTATLPTHQTVPVHPSMSHHCSSGLPLSPLQRQLPIACKQQQTTLTFKPFSTFILDTHTRTPLVTTAAANADPLEQPFQARLAHFVQEDQQTPRTCTALRVRQDRSY